MRLKFAESGGVGPARGARACAALGTALALALSPAAAGAADDSSSTRVGGFINETLAYTTSEPRHASRAVTRLQLTAEGRTGAFKWKLGGRADGDPVFANSGFYLQPVKKDQQFDLFWRENYVSFGAGDLEFTVGAQNIVWGEVAGLFFADVVSARDLREFLLPSFDIIRIPQGAVRTEYLKGDSKLELVWIPVPAFDIIGKPGSDFYPVPLPWPTPAAAAAAFADPVRPDRKLANSNYGLRAGTLLGGWDLAAFYYRSYAASPTFYRTAPNTFTPLYDRISQIGTTLSKDLQKFVVRAEAVYSRGQHFSTNDALAPQAVTERRTLDWIASAEFPFQTLDSRINVQLFQRHYFNGSSDPLLIDTGDIGASVLLSAKPSAAWEPSLQWFHVFGGGGTMVRPRLTWYPAKNLAAAIGADVFAGNSNGVFGRFTDRDRGYVDLRLSF